MNWKKVNPYFKWMLLRSPDKFRLKPSVSTHSMAVKNFKYHQIDTYKAITFGVCYFFSIDFLWWRIAIDLRKNDGWCGETYWQEVVPMEESILTEKQEE